MPLPLPGLTGPPPGRVLETRQLLFPPPFPDGQTETQRDVNDLPNPTDWLADVLELIYHSSKHLLGIESLPGLLLGTGDNEVSGTQSLPLVGDHTIMATLQSDRVCV